MPTAQCLDEVVGVMHKTGTRRRTGEEEGCAEPLGAFPPRLPLSHRDAFGPRRGPPQPPSRLNSRHL